RYTLFPYTTLFRSVQMLQELAEAGENTYGFEGFIKQLRGIELAANDIERTDAEQKLKAIQEQVESTKAEAAKLENMQVSFDMDEAQLERIRQQIVALAESMKDRKSTRLNSSH